MLLNYLIIAWRNLWNNKVFSLINITGLAVGMASFILIIKFVEFELSYENFHENKESIYRVSYKMIEQGDLKMHRAMSFNGLIPRMKEQIPEVENYCRIVRIINKGNLISHIDIDGNQRGFQEDKLYYVDTSFFNVFSYTLLAGNAESALTEPNSILLSEKYADKIFGSGWKNLEAGDEQHPLGKIIKVTNEEGSTDCLVTGIFQDQKPNSHLKIEILISHSTLHNGSIYIRKWWDNTYNYLLLKDGADPKFVEKKISQVIPSSMLERWKKSNIKYEFTLQPLNDIHLYSNIDSELEQNSDIKIVLLFVIIAIIVLIVAWVNYLNLTTVGSIYRRKEMGIRRVIGSSISQVFTQLITETILLNLIAAFLAITVAQICFPYFKQLTALPISGSLFSCQLVDPIVFWFVVAILFAIGALLAGIYPALIISSTKPSEVMRGSVTGNIISKNMAPANLEKRFLINGLVIFQFVISSILIGTTLTIYNQFEYMTKKDIGIDINDIMVIEGPGGVSKDTIFDRRKEVFRNNLMNIQRIKQVAFSNYLPGKQIDYGGWKRQNDNSENSTLIYGSFVGFNFLPTLNFEFVAGRNFTRNDEPSMSIEDIINNNQQILPIILNEKGVELLGFDTPEMAINEILVGVTKARVIGVVKNYNHYSLKFAHEPIGFFNALPSRGYALIKLEKMSTTRKSATLISAIEANWNRIFPDIPCNYYFLSDSYYSQYNDEKQLSRVVGIFTILSIVIAILGLFATTSFILQRRTKEIGIRKVMGASTRQLLELLTNRIFRLVFLSGIIAIPIFYVGINKWLEQYAFRIEISWWMFILPISFLILLSMCITGYHVLKTAQANPVKALRYE